MCGMVGYIGSREAMPVLLDGLQRLEYRGYDSAGLAVLDRRRIRITKRTGNLQNLQEALHGEASRGKIGIGHTRWATHGSPSQVNAHPQTDCSSRLAVVHNGIIEN